MNIYDLSGSGQESEQFDQLLSMEGIEIERIVSHAHATPEGEWYDQNWDEWVLVVSGQAGIRFVDSPDMHTLNAGDSLFFPANRRHRVEWTSAEEPTIWLAVHFNKSHFSKSESG